MANKQARQIDDFKEQYGIELTPDTKEDGCFKIKKFDIENKGITYFVIPREQHIHDPNNAKYIIQTSSEEAVVMKTDEVIPLTQKHHNWAIIFSPRNEKEYKYLTTEGFKEIDTTKDQDFKVAKRFNEKRAEVFLKPKQ